jgi:hypothetical protein
MVEVDGDGSRDSDLRRGHQQARKKMLARAQVTRPPAADALNVSITSRFIAIDLSVSLPARVTAFSTARLFSQPDTPNVADDARTP